MRFLRKIPAAALALAGSGFPQSAPAYNQNGLVLHNSTVQAVAVEFPGFRDPRGNAPGDCLWKVLEGDLLLTPRGRLHLSGLETCLEDRDARTPLDHPDVRLYGASRDSKGRLVPDFRRLLVKYSFGKIALPRSGPGNASGFWRINWTLGAPASIPVSDALHSRPFAVCLMATPGENHASGDGALLCLSAGENYSRAPQGSFSGFHQALSGRTGLFDGTEKTPDPASPYGAGELWVEPAFQEPILQPWCTSAAPAAPGRPDLGVGAVWTDLATGKGGAFGWRLESWQDASRGRRWAFLLLNLQGRPGTVLLLPGTASGLLMNPADPALTFLISPLKAFGPLREDRPPSLPPDFWDGLFEAGPLGLTPDPFLAGLDLWVGAVLVDLDRSLFTGASNTCVLHLR